MRLSHTFHSIPEWPITAQILSCLLVGGLLAGGGLVVYHATKSKQSKPNIAAYFGDLGASDTQYADAYTATKPGIVRMLVVGDISVYYGSIAASADYQASGMHAVTFTDNGCGISDGDTLVGTKRVPRDAACKGWQSHYKTVAGQYHPQVAVLLTGTMESEEQIVGGKDLVPGTVAWNQYLMHQLDEVRSAVAPAGTKLVLVTLPCEQTPSGTPNRVHRRVLNALWRLYAERASRRGRLADVNTFVPKRSAGTNPCGNRSSRRATRTLLQGFKVLWPWLASFADRLFRSAPRHVASAHVSEAHCPRAE